jgi:hypothetical protein
VVFNKKYGIALIPILDEVALNKRLKLLVPQGLFASSN